MNITQTSDGKKFAIEGFTELEMGLLYILVVEGKLRILSDVEKYHFQDPRWVKKNLEKLEKILYDWVATLRKNSETRKQLFK
jgi:hypothetical protein